MKVWNLKKLFDSQKGFVLIEFVIALPLIILLLYGLAQTNLKIVDNAKEQVADYILEVEAHDVLTRITQDLRAASYVKRSTAIGGTEIDKIEIQYHGASTYYYENDKKRFNEAQIFDIIDTRIYTVSRTENHGAYVYAQRQNGSISSPISGGNSFGETIVTKLKYTKLDERLIHITLEMQSVSTNEKIFGTNRFIKVSTAVFMPACEEMTGF